MPAPRTTVRPAAGIPPQLSAAQIAFLRETLAREQVFERQAVGVRAARPSSPRKPATRTSGRPPANRRAPARKPATRATAARLAGQTTEDRVVLSWAELAGLGWA